MIYVVNYSNQCLEKNSTIPPPSISTFRINYGQDLAIKYFETDPLPHAPASYILATVTGGVVVGTPTANNAITVAIGLRVAGDEVSTGIAAIEQNSSATVYINIMTNKSSTSGDFAVPITRPTQCLPTIVSFTGGSADYTINTSWATGEYSLEAVSFAQYLNGMWPNKFWVVSGAAKVAIY